LAPTETPLENERELLAVTRRMVLDEGLPGDGPRLDLALRALIRGTQIDMLSSVLSREIVDFAQRHGRLHPFHKGNRRV